MNQFHHHTPDACKRTNAELYRMIHKEHPAMTRTKQQQTLTAIYISRPSGIVHVRSFNTRDEARTVAQHMHECLYAIDATSWHGVWLGDHPAHNNDKEALSTFVYGNDDDTKPERIGA